jgi:hypothetical protein
VHFTHRNVEFVSSPIVAKQNMYLDPTQQM